MRRVHYLRRTGHTICSESRGEKLHDLQCAEGLATNYLVNEDKNVIFSMRCRVAVRHIAIPVL